jgi:hypothetical protein
VTSGDRSDDGTYRGWRPRPRRNRRRAGAVTAAMAGLGLAVVGCGNTFSGTTLPQQVTSWATASNPTLAASVTEIQGDIRRIDAVSDQAALPADCDVLVTDALNANQNLPSPDQTLTNLLARAYSDAGDAGHDCVGGAGAGSTSLARSARERATTRRDLIRALARFDAVTTP